MVASADPLLQHSFHKAISFLSLTDDAASRRSDKCQRTLDVLRSTSSEREGQVEQLVGDRLLLVVATTWTRHGLVYEAWHRAIASNRRCVSILPIAFCGLWTLAGCLRPTPYTVWCSVQYRSNSFSTVRNATAEGFDEKLSIKGL